MLLDGGEDGLGGVDVAVERHVNVRPERRLPGRRARGIDDTRLHGQNVGTLGHPPARDVVLRRRDLLACAAEVHRGGLADARIAPRDRPGERHVDLAHAAARLEPLESAPVAIRQARGAHRQERGDADVKHGRVVLVELREVSDLPPEVDAPTVRLEVRDERVDDRL